MTRKKIKAFPPSVPRNKKSQAGATPVERTPLSIRARGLVLSEETDRYMRNRLGEALGKFADRIERLMLRFEDQNGPRGGVDIVCQVTVVLSGLPAVVVEERGENDRQSFGRLVPAVTRAVRRTLEREGTGASRGRSRGKEMAGGSQPPAFGDGSIIGRRVGRGPANLKAALDRPERRRRDQPVDTSLPGVSASDRKAGYGSTARRNTKARTTKATATLEDSSQDRPSRKSTRRSANRTKSGTNLTKKARATTTSPSARASRERR